MDLQSLLCHYMAQHFPYHIRGTPFSILAHLLSCLYVYMLTTKPFPCISLGNNTAGWTLLMFLLGLTQYCSSLECTSYSMNNCHVLTRATCVLLFLDNQFISKGEALPCMVNPHLMRKLSIFQLPNTNNY